jgi:integrase
LTVRERIRASTTLTSQQRYDITWGIRAFGEGVGRPLSELPAHLLTLLERPAGLTPDLAGLDVEALKRFERRWDNVVRLTRVGMEHVGITPATRRLRPALTANWIALLDLVTDKYDRMILSRLARYGSARDIDPGQVDDAIFRAFLAQLIADTVYRPHKKQRKVAALWNRWAASEPAWPGRPVKVPDYSKTYALPWSVFRPSLKAEYDDCLDWLAGTDKFAERDFRPLRPSSLRTRTHQFRAYISALVHRGIDPRTLHGLRDVVAVDAVKTGLRFFLDRAPADSTEQASGIARFITSLAHHWVKVDPPHLKALRAICKSINPGYLGMSLKNRERLAQFDDPANLKKLYELPGVLVAIASDEKRPSRTQALLVQTAVAIEILLMLPIRRKNLAELDIKRHLVRSGDTMRIVIPRHEVKNRVAIDAALPPHLINLIDLYRTTYRPLLVSAPSDCLFPGATGRPKRGDGLAAQISKCIKDRCGLLMNVHLFRHLSAQTWLDKHPGGYGVVRLLLGHESVETTTRYYCGRETKAAVLHFDEHVMQLRASLATTPAPQQPGAGR